VAVLVQGMTDPQGFRTIVFDFDYTLADSSPGVIESVNYALARLGLPGASDEAIRKTIGLSLPNTLLMLAGEEHAAHADEFYRLFVERADEVMHNATQLFGFVPDVVQQLRDDGFRLGIVSSKFRRRIEAVLERDGLGHHFEVIVGGEDVTAFKPDPSGLFTAIERLSSTSQDTLYVGDSVTDAETARRASVPFVAVLSGMTPHADFANHPAHEVLGNVSELPGLLRSGLL